MAEYEVTRIFCSVDPRDSSKSLLSLCGHGWIKLEDQVIYEIRTQSTSFYVNIRGRRVELVVATEGRREYLSLASIDPQLMSPAVEPDSHLAMRRYQVLRAMRPNLDP